MIYARFNGIDFNKIKFIGITGTNGKTTTASLIYRILSASNNSVGFIGTGKIEINGKIISDKNYSMTTPDPKILYKAIKAMENEGCEFIVAEISSHLRSEFSPTYLPNIWIFIKAWKIIMPQN